MLMLSQRQVWVMLPAVQANIQGCTESLIVILALLVKGITVQTRFSILADDYKTYCSLALRLCLVAEDFFSRIGTVQLRANSESLLREAPVLERPPALFPYLCTLFRLAILRHAHAKVYTSPSNTYYCVY